MKVLQFRTQKDLDEWLNDNELFECYDNKHNLLGHILGPDADNLVMYGIAQIYPEHRFCHVYKNLTDEQVEKLKKNTLVKTVVLDSIFRLSLEQRVVIKRLRECFDEARKVGLCAVSCDDENAMYLFNGKAFDDITNDDNLSGEWKEVDGVRKFVPYSEEELSNYVKIDTELDCEKIAGDNRIDFMSWGSGALPWFAHLKP